MIYEFKSRATGSLIMTNDVAETLLHIIGKPNGTKGTKGVIVPDAMPAAIAALNKEIALQKNSEESVDNEGKPKVSLSQRAFPFIEMLQRAHKAGKEITWGT
jgi:hypothetical protein